MTLPKDIWQVKSTSNTLMLLTAAEGSTGEVTAKRELLSQLPMNRGERWDLQKSIENFRLFLQQDLSSAPAPNPPKDKTLEITFHMIMMNCMLCHIFWLMLHLQTPEEKLWCTQGVKGCMS